MYEHNKMYVARLLSREEIFGVDERLHMNRGHQRVAYLNRLTQFSDKMISVRYDSEEDIFWFGRIQIPEPWLEDIERLHIHL